MIGTYRERLSGSAESRRQALEQLIVVGTGAEAACTSRSIDVRTIVCGA